MFARSTSGEHVNIEHLYNYIIISMYVLYMYFSYRPLCTLQSIPIIIVLLILLKCKYASVLHGTVLHTLHPMLMI